MWNDVYAIDYEPSSERDCVSSVDASANVRSTEIKEFIQGRLHDQKGAEIAVTQWFPTTDVEKQADDTSNRRLFEGIFQEVSVSLERGRPDIVAQPLTRSKY
jgi:hypothetical protein